jgi:ornithine cyclodeaminase/alanine dehydrogenase-like protein (mu-crystallin family)
MLPFSAYTTPLLLHSIVGARFVAPKHDGRDTRPYNVLSIRDKKEKRVMARILSRADVQHCLTMSDAIAIMRIAFRALAAGKATLPQRAAVDLPEQGVALLMPSLLQTEAQHTFSLKVITVMPRNPFRALPLSFASVLLLDALTGRTLAVMEGGWLTAMRTGAVVGLATDLLARRDASVLALFGAGAQAVTQVLALHTVRPLQEVRVVNRSEAHYQQLVESLHTLLGNECPPIHRAATAHAALADALLVACATTATTPLFSYEDVMPGAHINAIGAFTPAMCEVGADTLAHARIIVDQREAALAEAGDLLQAFAAGAIAGPEQWQELGTLVHNDTLPPRRPTDITFFKSVGIAIQDAAVAQHVYHYASANNIGLEADV